MNWRGWRAQLEEKGFPIKLCATHGDGRSQMEDGSVKICSVLPFGEQALPVEGSKLTVAKPDGGQVGGGVASAAHQMDADNAIFPTVALGPFYAEFMKSFEVLLSDGRNFRALFRIFDEGAEGGE